MVQGRVILALAFAALAGGARAGNLDAQMGKALFERNWVAAPSSTKSNDGLGPLYDARSCSSCHANGGPGRIGVIGAGMAVRIGNERGTGDPLYGTQLQTRALPGLTPEGAPRIEWLPVVALREPHVLGALNFGALAEDSRVALRRAPSLRGIGLLASIPRSEILSRADPSDRNRDGISGRAGTGRFGWKATQPTIAAQDEMALMRDIGLSTTGHPDPWGECTAAESKCRAGPHGAKPGEVEVPDALRDLIVAYLISLPPPKPLNTGSRGRAVFEDIGCAACHADPRGAGGKPVPAYSDLLLHDMGVVLDDGIAEGNAHSSEWRTAPLWDVAEELAKGGLMHDGPARSVEEAIEWHGGEAARARAKFDALPAPDKAALVAFLSGR